LLAAALVAVLLLFAASGSVERGRAANGTCRYGLSSIGPVHFQDGKIVGGDLTPHTETCLP
jgi:hypothetical protein